MELFDASMESALQPIEWKSTFSIVCATAACMTITAVSTC
jgi:hypothetical protein